MSDNEDLLGDDLGDQSLADYNLGNEEEEQLLADDYDSAGPQNVPTSIGSSYREPVDMGPPDYPSHIEYNEQPAAPVESPQIVPSDVNAQIQNGDLGGPRERFVSERPPGAQRLPQVRDIPDTLDKVVIPRGGFPRGRTSWRNPQPSPPHNRPEIHPEIRPEIRPEMRPDIRPELRPEMRPDMRMEPPDLPPMGPEISPERPLMPQDMPPMYRPPMERPPFIPRFQFRPHMDERPQFGPVRPNFEPRPVFYRPHFPPRQFAPPMREIVPNASHMPQVTIRQALPLPGPRLPVYIPTRIQKSPPLSPTIENKFGPVKDIDDAAERFIAEQRNALARAAVRKYIENTTIEIENELAAGGRRRSHDDDDLLRRQEEFINANRAGLRRSERENQEKEALLKTPDQPAPSEPEKVVSTEPNRPDTTRSSPDKEPAKPEVAKEPARDRSPIKEEVEVNSTCDLLRPQMDHYTQDQV
ncbi:hypothetical protein HF086_016930 [Spodoptera exigua]|uniref:Uncharacterized protein n=1 Tax=Spodoptera exigua TaxID=7107 RepID=A0A922MG33_SPOEX|nr:hypothetical protein HF086_016930 [Spodoptera exigua]